MRISLQWLREWVAVSESAEAIGHRLTMAGLELDALEPAAPDFSGVNIGEVVRVEAHPNADRLRVCEVSVGTGETLSIVCGAPNVAVGMRAPVAMIGAVLPNDLRIKRSRLRGVESQGMLCSASELGLAEHASGLLPLPGDAPLGADFRTWLGLDDRILEVDLTPNRADCLGMRGIAREVGVLLQQPVTEPDCSPVPAVTEARVAVTLAAPEACPTYVARVIEGLDPQASTPLWLHERLRRAGIRPVHPVVDVTNYVLLELGQPMHAFAADAVSGGINVRFAQPGERLRLLNDAEIAVGPQDLLITDAQGGLALAGIMGGLESAVQPDTTRIILESAHFTPTAIAGRARAHGLHTDASHRFERGVDPTLPALAMERATALILAIAGGQPGPTLIAGSIPDLRADAAITLRRERIPRLLGWSLPDAEVVRILSGLGCQVATQPEGWAVTPLRARFDLTREEDLIEELARVHGYEQLPQTLPQVAPPVLSRRTAALQRCKQLLVEAGFYEVVSFSFIPPDWAQAFYPEAQALALSNPISSELAVMRPGLWPGLLRTLAHNRARQQPDLQCFEFGLRFVPTTQGLQQEMQLAGLLHGRAYPEQWANPNQRGLDFYDAKGVVEMLCLATGKSLQFKAAAHPALHPGQSAQVLLDQQPVGWLGALHPALAQRFALPSAYLFELDAEVLRHDQVPQLQPLSAFPAIRRDLALVVSRDTPAAEILAAIEELQLPLVQEMRLFDVYQGEGLEKYEKSLALGLIFRAFDRTLGEEDEQAVITAILDHLKARLGVRTRYQV